MVIDEEALKELIEPRARIEETSSISSDGRNLLTRIPKNIATKANIKKGQNIRWLIDGIDNKLKIELIEDGHTEKKENN
jgi:hypothetical protein